MPNGSLFQLLHQRRQTLTAGQRVGLNVHVAEGIQYLHSRSPPFVHRDLKSMNVVLDYQLNAKLCDFGFTECMENTHISRRAQEEGSPRYMSPELFDSKGKITEKVDIWALGCLILEVFTSRLPHEECQTIQQVMAKTLVNRQLPFLDVGHDLQPLADLCFIFDPKNRANAGQVLDGLRNPR